MELYEVGRIRFGETDYTLRRQLPFEDTFAFNGMVRDVRPRIFSETGTVSAMLQFHRRA